MREFLIRLTFRRYTIIDSWVFIGGGGLLGSGRLWQGFLFMVIGIVLSTAFESWYTYGWDKE